jgi:hypothetical protein
MPTRGAKKAKRTGARKADKSKDLVPTNFGTRSRCSLWTEYVKEARQYLKQERRAKSVPLKDCLQLASMWYRRFKNTIHSGSLPTDPTRYSQYAVTHPASAPATLAGPPVPTEYYASSSGTSVSRPSWLSPSAEDAGPGLGSDSDTETETETDTDTGTETETDSGTETDTESGTDHSDTDSDTDSDADSDADMQPQPRAVSGYRASGSTQPMRVSGSPARAPGGYDADAGGAAEDDDVFSSSDGGDSLTGSEDGGLDSASEGAETLGSDSEGETEAEAETETETETDATESETETDSDEGEGEADVAGVGRVVSGPRASGGTEFKSARLLSGSLPNALNSITLGASGPKASSSTMRFKYAGEEGGSRSTSATRLPSATRVQSSMGLGTGSAPRFMTLSATAAPGSAPARPSGSSFGSVSAPRASAPGTSAGMV